MSVPFYVSPEQQMRDRADFARKGISRGRCVVALSTAEGIALVADNASRNLNKVSEIYDRIGFAAVGRYNEFDALRIAGIQQADLRGYSYDRRDVNARALAKYYSQLLGGTFAAAGAKPFEVELAVAELGTNPEEDALFHIGYDGTITEASGVLALGRDTQRISELACADHDSSAGLREAVALASRILDEAETLDHERLEVAFLERNAPRRRTFRRITPHELPEWLASS